MFAKLSKVFFLSILVVGGLVQNAVAQSVDKVKLDVLSALSTPLPITIVGPLLTRDVVVTQEGGAFRAVLKDATLMGLFPIGEVSMRLEPLDADRYRISELGFPNTLNFPGIGTLQFSGMTLDGTWSATQRSYSDLKWVTRDLKFEPGQGDQGSIAMGTLGFDVVKEPDNADTESRFEITASDLAVIGMGPDNVTLARVRALLAANGEQPVDLYSVIREVVLLGSVRDGGSQLKTLGNSLLGNRYDTVVLDLSAQGLSVKNARKPDASFLEADGVTVRASLNDITASHWGGAEVAVSLSNLKQREYLPDTATSVEMAEFRFGGADLPVADMVGALMLLADPPRNRPVAASRLLDGMINFERLEFDSRGKGLWVEAFDRRWRENAEPEIVTAFETGYDSWSLHMGLADFNRNAGRLSFLTEALGGRFVPGDDIPQQAHMHIKAWFPVGLRLQSVVSDLNEGLLKRMFTDVMLRDLNEPVEAILPLAIYGAATVLDVATGEDFYETELFRVEQKGHFRLFPTEVLNLVPYEGTAEIRLRGLDALLGYFDEAQAQLGDIGDVATGLSAGKSALIVLRNIAEDAGESGLKWRIDRHDVTRSEIELNGITLRYPDLMQFMPALIFGMVGYR